MDAYDVIIIGTGAGGAPWLGTSRLRASASSCSSAATGSRASRLLPRHVYIKNEIPVAGCAHQGGTGRFGTDPATVALNTDCWAHELDNLYVVDTRVFPSIGVAVNRALTAMANALRVGDHIERRLGA